MDHHEQMTLEQMGVMLDEERDLKENVAVTIGFACEQIKHQEQAAIASRQEGYGVAMQYYNSLGKAAKGANAAVKDFLDVLPASDSDAIFAASKLYDAAVAISYEAVKLAAQADRIRTDLYKKAAEEEPEKTPMEEYMEGVDDDFEEANEGKE